jgi:hypothetical protein
MRLRGRLRSRTTATIVHNKAISHTRRNGMNAELIEPSTVNRSVSTRKEGVTRKIDPQRRKPSMTDTQKSAKSTTSRASKGFTDEDGAAMKERAKKLKAAAGENELVAKPAETEESDRDMAEQLHVTASVPALSPCTW